MERHWLSVWTIQQLINLSFVLDCGIKNVQVFDLGDEAATFFPRYCGGTKMNHLQNICHLVYQIFSSLRSGWIYVPPEARTSWGCCPKSSGSLWIILTWKASQPSTSCQRERSNPHGPFSVPMLSFVILNPLRRIHGRSFVIGTTAVVHIVKGWMSSM